jgi:protein-tyrosine phosphatase
VRTVRRTSSPSLPPVRRTSSPSTRRAPSRSPCSNRPDTRLSRRHGALVRHVAVPLAKRAGYCQLCRSSNRRYNTAGSMLSGPNLKHVCWGQSVRTVLFLCTGNYYRSRYAEIVFNWRAAARGMSWRAESRGLRRRIENRGPLSPFTVEALLELGIPAEPHLRDPLTADDSDFEAAQRIIALKEAEHRSMIERSFPAYLERVEFWHVHDIDVAPPKEALPEIARQVNQLLDRLAGSR